MTAISVSRDCGMVRTGEKIALIEVNIPNELYNIPQTPFLNVSILGAPAEGADQYAIIINNLVRKLDRFAFILIY